MDNPQDIHWFSGFFEGEGCFSLRIRNIQGKILEPKISISNTDELAIEECLKVLTNNFIWPIQSFEKRPNKLKCYALDISSLQNCSRFCNTFYPYIECDRKRLEIIRSFCISKTRYSEISEYQWQLHKELSQWRSSETTCETTYTLSLDWLVGIMEAEGCFMNHAWTQQPSIAISNTNRSIIEKAKRILQSININPHIKDYPKINPNYQTHWVLSIHGKSKVGRFIEKCDSLFRFRDIDKLKI